MPGGTLLPGVQSLRESVICDYTFATDQHSEKQKEDTYAVL
ncbi:hypothetical protein [Citrobacter freundii]|uniref:Uncharacterized protein n=1 Tax=Citrobacter freundii TaxID=546 RepID=A0A7G2IX20_CITFR|nr:hypothetical protein [Citrobacter freundii]